MSELAIKRFRVKNFKAIRDSGAVEFGPLTMLIGNNGSGKSSFIEGLETYQAIIKQDLDVAMNRWRGFEHIHNIWAPYEVKTSDNGAEETNLMEFDLKQEINSTQFRSTMSVTLGKDNKLCIQSEKLFFGNKGKKIVERQQKARDILVNFPEFPDFEYVNSVDMGGSILSKTLQQSLWLSLLSMLKRQTISSSNQLVNWLETINNNDLFRRRFDWQFMVLNPEMMGVPIPQKRTGGEIQLNKNGSNIAEYLMSIQELNPVAFKGILETLQHVLPYAQDLRTVVTEELERAVYLQLIEKQAKIASWLLSTGTLRLVALLALLRHPNPPPLIIIEEIENGLDPRTIHLIVEEIRNVVESGETQIIATTHSPYFLDLLFLEDIVLVERDNSGQPLFFRPHNKTSLAAWAKKFTPGKLYTMGKLSPQS